MFPEKIQKKREVIMLTPAFYDLLHRAKKDKRLTKGEIIEYCLSEVLIKQNGYLLLK